MRWISPIVALAGLLVGGGALPPVDCGASAPAPRGVAATLEPTGLISVVGVVGHASTTGSPLGRGVGQTVGATPSAAASAVNHPCGVAAEPVGIASGTLRNDTADALHGLQPTEGLHSPLSDSRTGFR